MKARLIICFFPLINLLSLFSDLHANGLYTKKDSWAQTMLTSRGNYLKWKNEQTVKCGHWHVTMPIKVRDFADNSFLDGDIDLRSTDDQGNPIWQERPRWKDDNPHGLKGEASIATYLVRTLNSSKATEVTARIGTENGLEVWLNGEKLYSKALCIRTYNCSTAVQTSKTYLYLQISQTSNAWAKCCFMMPRFAFKTGRAAQAVTLMRALMP